MQQPVRALHRLCIQLGTRSSGIAEFLLLAGRCTADCSRTVSSSFCLSNMHWLMQGHLLQTGLMNSFIDTENGSCRELGMRQPFHVRSRQGATSGRRGAWGTPGRRNNNGWVVGVATQQPSRACLSSPGSPTGALFLAQGAGPSIVPQSRRHITTTHRQMRPHGKSLTAGCD